MVFILIAMGLSLWSYPQLPEHVEQVSNNQWVSQRRFLVTVIPVCMLLVTGVFQLALPIGRKHLDIDRIRSFLRSLLLLMLSLLLVTLLLFYYGL